MNIYMMILAALVAILSATSAGAEPPPANHRILSQPGAPIGITEYSAKYQEGDRYQREGIRHWLKYRNQSDRKIVAVSFGLLAFNIFNEFQDRLGGFAIEDVDPGMFESGVWVTSARAESSFYTGVAYVNKVRFEDGAIWSADTDKVAAQLREIEEDFDIEDIKQ